MTFYGAFGEGYGGERALVLGATGFIGQWVSRMLAEAKADLFVSVHRRDAGDVPGEPIAADLAVPGAATTIVERVRPSIVFNLAGYGVDPAERDAGLARRINGGLPAELCRAVAGIPDPLSRRIVHVGSGIEYGLADGNLHENTLARPTTLYARTKLAGTRRLASLCRALGLRGLTARPFTVYGPGERERRLLPSLLRTARLGDVLDLTAGNQLRDFIFVEDVAAGLLRLGLSNVPPGMIVNLATGRLTAVRDFCEIAAGILGIPPDRLRYGALPAREDEMVHLGVSIARLRRLTGWVPTTGIAAGIHRTREVGNHR